MTRISVPDSPEPAVLAKIISRVGGLEFVLEEASSDAVVLTNGEGDLLARVTAAVDAGRHVLLPAAPLPQQTIARLVQVMLRGGRVIAWLPPRRFLPRLEEMRSSCAGGRLGPLGLVRTHRWTSSGELDSMLAEELDIIAWLFGERPERVFSSGDAASGYVQVHLGFSEGGMALLDVQSDLPDGTEYYSVTAIGARGAAYADDHRNSHLLLKGGRAAVEFSEESAASLEFDGVSVARLEAFCRLLSRPPDSLGKGGAVALLGSAAAVVQATNAVGTSLRQGISVRPARGQASGTDGAANPDAPGRGDAL